MKNITLITILILFNTTIYIFAGNLEERLIDKNEREKVIAEIYEQEEKFVPEMLDIISSKGMSLKSIEKTDTKKTEKKRQAKIASTLFMGKLKRKEAKKIIENNLNNDEDKFVREASAIALMEMNLDQKAVLKAEGGRLKAEEKQKRKMNKEEINESIKALQKALDDESGNVRMRAILALVRIRQNSEIGSQNTEIGIEELKKRALKGIKSENVTESFLAIEAIETIGDKNMTTILKQNFNNKNVWIQLHSKIAVKSLETQGITIAEKLKYLKETLEDEQYEISKWAAEELAKENAKEADEILEEAANNKNYAAGKVLLWKKR